MYKQRIIEAATKLFITGGVRASTMDDVARSAGVSKRTIYEHFKDKKELLNCIVENTHVKVIESEDEIFSRSDNVLEALMEIMKLHHSDVNVKKMKMMFEIKRFYPDVRPGFSPESKIEKMQRVFERGMAEGVFRKDLNPKTAAFLFSEQAHALFVEWAERINETSFEISSLQVIRDLFVNFLRGISTSKGIDIMKKYYGADSSQSR